MIRRLGDLDAIAKNDTAEEGRAALERHGEGPAHLILAEPEGRHLASARLQQALGAFREFNRIDTGSRT